MMDPIYVVGHKNPDTDSVVSAMAYAALHNALGENEYVAARQGTLNDETNFLLEKFGFKAPMLLTTVRTQVSDIDYDHPPKLGCEVPVSRAWQLFRENEALSVFPVIREDGSLYGLLTKGSIAENDMASIDRPQVENVPIYNLLSAIEGRILNNEDDTFDTISGEIVISLPGSGLNQIRGGSLVLCGNQEDVIDRALEVGASCVIVCQSEVPDRYRGISSSTCLIATPADAIRVARMINQSLPVSRVCSRNAMETFHTSDFLDDVREAVLKSRYRAYPVLDEENNVVGTLGRYHLMRPRRKRVVLVDHNELGQSVPGLDQARIMAIVDHHRLADVQTGYPTFMRNEPVGSTTTIVATMYQERGLMPSPAMAGLMAAAVISDTVMFKSPTCTPQDRKIAERLANRAGIDLDSLGREIFSVGGAANRPVEELLETDFKEFHIAGHILGIGQVTTLDTAALLERLEEILAAMEKKKAEKGYDLVLLMLTNVLLEGTELIFSGDPEVIRSAFNAGEITGNHIFLPGIMSRKKQVVPALSLMWG